MRINWLKWLILIARINYEARERVIKFALYEQLKDTAEVERIFAIIKQQPEY